MEFSVTASMADDSYSQFVAMGVFDVPWL
jgi:hypothetical protein